MTTEELLNLLKKKADAEGIPENFPVLSAAAVARCEKEMGVQLPELVKLIYTKVANGGIGPGESMLELTVDESDGEEEDVLSFYTGLMASEQVHEDFDDEAGDIVMEWIPGVVPLFYWGCACYTLIDCNTPEGMMVDCDFDYGPVNFKTEWVEGNHGHFRKLGVSFFDYMASWVDPSAQSKYAFGGDLREQ